MTETPAAQRILAVLCGLLLLGGVVGLFTVDGDDADVLTSGGSTTTSVPAGDGGDQGGGDPSSTASTAPGDTSVTTVGGAPTTKVDAPAPTSAPAPGGDPGPMAAPRVGLYKYATTMDDKASETQLRVEHEAAQGEERRMFKQSGEDAQQELSVAFRGDGAFVRTTTFHIAQNTIECDWEPDIRNVAAPLKTGLTWNFESRCTTTFNGEKAEFHLTGTNKVNAPQKVKIGGRDIDVWPIERTSHLTVDTTFQTRPIHFEQDSTGVDLFAPRIGLDVRSTSDSTTTAPGQPPSKNHTTRELLSLDPQ